MTTNASHHQPNPAKSLGEELTSKLGIEFSDICHWAVENDLQLPLEVGYLILGLNPLTVGIGNLAHELSHSESLIITARWCDNPLVQELARFSAAFMANIKISRSYSNIPHAGGAAKNRRQFDNYKGATFLLALVTHPLADITDSQTYEDRRRLRIWLLIQAASRLLEFGYPADQSISTVARFLLKDSGNEDWQVIDELLLRSRQQLEHVENTFERFTSALGNAARHLKDEKCFAGRTQLIFLNAIISVAAGEVHAIENKEAHLHTISRRSYLHVFESAVQTQGMDDLNSALPIISDDPDEPSFALITEIDPTESPAQQTLRSGSVYIQTMTESHYLPWSWERVLPPEATQLESWIDAQLASPEPKDQTGAACVWLAITVGRSLALVEKLAISSEIEDEWSVSNDFQYLQRKSPRRKSGWKPDEQSRGLVEPFRNDLLIHLPTRIGSIFHSVVKGLAETAIPENCGQLWRAVSTSHLEPWFNEQARKFFPRLTSSKLANYQPQRLFDQSGEFSFPRLLASHPNSALPGACSYATWDIKAIEQGLQLPIVGSAEAGSSHIMGSLLAPLDDVVNTEIRRCTARLQDESQKGLIQYHNALAQYVVMALYAATGARPLRDPFESLQHFSFKRGCVFVNDKSSDGLHSGRLIPLPEKAVALVKHYVAFLGKLSLALHERRPELTDKISQLANGQPEAGMPLFFLLDSALQWRSMADAEALNSALFEWGLPANLLRHRYVQQLLQLGVHPEVLEGWMGHAERGVASYSDYSARCWQVDANDNLHLLDQGFESLPFEIPPVVKLLPPLLFSPIRIDNYSEPIRFGQQARERNRRYRLKAALNEAKSDIALFLNQRLISELDEHELNQLSRRMLLRENRLPHPQAALRYRVFLKLLQREVNNNAQVADAQEDGSKQDTSSAVRCTLLNRRLVRLSEERSLVTPDIIQALENYTDLVAWAAKARKAVLKGQLGKAQALYLGTVLLAIEKRLGYQRQLQDVMHGKSFRLVQDKKHLYLEYSEILEPDDYSMALQRHQISYKTASLLAHGVHQKKSVSLPSPVDIDALQPLLALYAKNNPAQGAPCATSVLEWLCKTINLANLVELPGIVAAALSDRSPPTSASLRDHVRLLSGRVLDLPAEADSQELPTIPIARTLGQNSEKHSLQGQAKALTNEIAAALLEYMPAQAREHAQHIRSVCKGYQGLVSPSMLMLGYWIADLMATGKAPRRKKMSPFALNSLTTYWSSLAPAFRGLLYEIDLVSLDSEEITELCAQMLEYRLQTSPRADYFGKRLQSFFRWAARFGVASPEWSELALASDHRTVSAGLISEAEYQTCLQNIQSDISLALDEKNLLSFALLGTYRFGLRPQEAIGLLRSDWCQNENDIWVLVQNNQYRTLKTAASRRAIPLLFELSDIEMTVIEHTLARYSSIAGAVKNRPIFCELATDGAQPILSSLAPRISNALIQQLKSVTGNPDMVLHHCRHTFYNRVAAALLDLKTPLAEQLLEESAREKIRRIVLGPVNSVSRRSAMALARLMGHRYPSTGLKNYFHLATDWADILTTASGQRTHKIPYVFQVSEQRSAVINTGTSLSDSLVYPELTLTRILQTLRLVSLGITYERAGELMQLEPSVLARLKQTFELTNSRMRFSSPKNKNKKIKGVDAPNALLEVVSSDAWQRLLSHTEKTGELRPIDWGSVEEQHLYELPYLVSQNRHFLMEQTAHCKVMKYVVDLFEVSDSRYRVIVKNNSGRIMESLIKVGFSPGLESDGKTILDSFATYLIGRENHYRAHEYGGLVLSRSAVEVIRNSVELTVALLATVVFLQIAYLTSSG